MKTIKITTHLFDVFIGDGCENWSRWSKSKDGFIKQIGGKDVPKFVKHSIIEVIGGK